jgi:hypothetical protein
MSDSDNARLWIVRKKYRSFFGSNLNRAAARSLASSAAFLVKAKKAILVGSTPLCVYLMDPLLGYPKPFCNSGLGNFLFVNQTDNFFVPHFF